MNQQLTLAIQPQQHAKLEDFIWSGNTIVQKAVENLLQRQGERFLYIRGSAGTGKSHLLQGVCQYYLQNNLPAIYLPLSMLNQLGPECLEDLADQQLIALDDIEAVANNQEWEQALFALYNQIFDNNSTFLITSSAYSVTTTPLQLMDLRSRLNWGISLQLHELADQQKISLLQHQASSRGIFLTDAVALYIIQRATRDVHHLSGILDALDNASLSAQRKITIPFVKQVLRL